MRSKNIQLIGVCVGAGGKAPSNATAPQVIRKLGLINKLRALGIQVNDLGDITTVPSEAAFNDPNINRLGELLPNFKAIFNYLINIEPELPILLGGDHSMSIATIAAQSARLKIQHGTQAELGLLWIDAHPDLNLPESSPSGDVHGMSVSVLLGHGNHNLTNLSGVNPVLKPANVIFIGARQVDQDESDLIAKLGLRVYTIPEIEKRGIVEVIKEAVQILQSRTAGFVASFDLDVCDPSVAPGVATPVVGGLDLGQAKMVMQLLGEAAGLKQLELVELNPDKDVNGLTSNLAVELLLRFCQG